MKRVAPRKKGLKLAAPTRKTTFLGTQYRKTGNPGLSLPVAPCLPPEFVFLTAKAGPMNEAVKRAVFAASVILCTAGAIAS